MRNTRLAALLGLTLAAPLFAAEKTATAEGVTLTYDDAAYPEVKTEVKKKLTAKENGSDIPTDVAPKHPIFWLWDKKDLDAKAAAKDDSVFTRSQIAVFPLSDSSVPKFAKAYPDISEGATKLAAYLKKSPKEIPWFSLKVDPEKRKTITIPEMEFMDAATAFQTKLQYLDNDQIHGVFYLTSYTQEDVFYPSSDNLYYNFAGLTKDGRFSILAQFAVGHSSLPANFDAAPESAKTGKISEAELKKAVAALTAQADDSFAPKLGDLRTIVESLKLPAKAGK